MSKDVNNVYRLAHTMIRVKDLESSFVSCQVTSHVSKMRSVCVLFIDISIRTNLFYCNL